MRLSRVGVRIRIWVGWDTDGFRFSAPSQAEYSYRRNEGKSVPHNPSSASLRDLRAFAVKILFFISSHHQLQNLPDRPPPRNQPPFTSATFPFTPIRLILSSSLLASERLPISLR